METVVQVNHPYELRGGKMNQIAYYKFPDIGKDREKFGFMMTASKSFKSSASVMRYLIDNLTPSFFFDSEDVLTNVLKKCGEYNKKDSECEVEGEFHHYHSAGNTWDWEYTLRYFVKRNKDNRFVVIAFSTAVYQ